MKEYPIKPLDHAVWWAEHVIKYGGDHLQSPAANISSLEYYDIELIIIVLIILMGVLACLIVVVRKVSHVAITLFPSNMKFKIN